MMIRRFVLLFAVAYMVPGGLIAAVLPNGDEVAEKINAREEGVAVMRNLTMHMTDRRGKTRIRETRAFRKYYGQEKRTVIFYLKPKNIQDTAFMTYDYPEANRDDDQWLYLPAMRKVRRISASDRGDYFLGTDLTYEDIKLETRISLKDYDRKIIGESEVDGHHCFILQSKPINQNIAKELGYGKVEQCVDSKIWFIRQAKFWDIKEQLLKTSTFSGIRQVQGIWTQHRIDVINHKTDHKTQFLFTDVDYQTGVDDDVFTQNTLRRGL